MPQQHGTRPSDQALEAVSRFADQVAAELEWQGKTSSPEIYVEAMELGLRLQDDEVDGAPLDEEPPAC